MRIIIEIPDEFADAVRRLGPAARLEVGGLFGRAFPVKIVGELKEKE